MLVRPVLAGAQWARCEGHSVLAGVQVEHMGPGDLGDKNAIAPHVRGKPRTWDKVCRCQLTY